MEDFIVKNLLDQKPNERLAFIEQHNLSEIGSTAVALLNGKGGDILVGVDNEGVVKGILDGTQSLKTLHKSLLEWVRPKAPMSLSLNNVSSKKVILVSLWPGAKGPYSFNGKIYIRKNRQTLLGEAGDIYELANKTKKAEFHWERQAVLGLELEDLDLYEVRNVMKLHADFNSADDIEEFMAALGLYRDGHFTNAAALLFAREPARFFPQIRMRVTIYQGEKGGNELSYDKQFDGNLFRNFEAVWDFFTATFGHGSKIRGVRRSDRLNFPELALREGLLNAIVHRDYSSISSFLHVSLYADRLEIANYGGLPGGQTVEELRVNHQSILRNPDIAEVFFICKYIEKIGTGTQRMIRECRANGFKDPDWSGSGNELTKVVFPGLGVVGGKVEGITEGINEGINRLVTEKQNEGLIGGITEGVIEVLTHIVSLLQREAGLNTRMISEKLDIPYKTLERHIATLKDLGAIEHVGSKRSGGYVIKKEQFQ
ncbi:MAG: helix-turn-helix domain-containing protein [Roseivirga sp.]